jgi:hypothetical protein
VAAAANTSDSDGYYGDDDGDDDDDNDYGRFSGLGDAYDNIIDGSDGGGGGGAYGGESSTPAPPQQEEEQEGRRRRLGMAGQPAWHWLRSTAALWTLHFFGGYPRHACGDKCDSPPVSLRISLPPGDVGRSATEPAWVPGSVAAAAAVGAAAAAHASARPLACWVDALASNFLAGLGAPALAHRNHGLNCSRTGPPPGWGSQK